MYTSSIQTIQQLKEVLVQIPESCYSKPCTMLSGATIGQHTRHLIEMYQCTINGYDTGEVCYDKRERNKRIEKEVIYAVEQLTNIQDTLEKPNKKMTIAHELMGEEVRMDSNYHRELMYNLDHMIHHKALMKIGISLFTDIALPESFGVAPSTISHRKQCAQ